MVDSHNVKQSDGVSTEAHGASNITFHLGRVDRGTDTHHLCVIGDRIKDILHKAATS